MALIGYNNASVASTDTYRRHTLGSKAVDDSADEYRYVYFTAEVQPYRLVAIDRSFNCQAATEALIDGASPKPAVSISVTCPISTYGWVKVYGSHSIRCKATCKSTSVIFPSTTAGSVDDSGTTEILGIYVCTTVTISASATKTCFIYAEPTSGKLIA